MIGNTEPPVTGRKYLHIRFLFFQKAVYDRGKQVFRSQLLPGSQILPQKIGKAALEQV